jgi:hypothetical protein
MPNIIDKKKKLKLQPSRFPEVLDVHLTATLLMVSRDTVYDLFASGELPGREVAGDGSLPKPPFCAGLRACRTMTRLKGR